MKTTLLCTVLLSALCGNAASAEFCHYPNTNRLVWDDDFSQRIHRFLGERRESFFYNGLLYEQVLAGLGGPPDPILDVGNGSRFASACRAHSCTEKAAVVIACPDEVLAVGILHFNIGLQRFNAMHATLTIYSDRLDGQVRSAFENWRRHVAEVDAIDIATDYRHLLRPTPQPPETHRRLSKQITK